MSFLSDTTVAILSYNRLEDLKKTIPPRILDVINSQLELVIVDNASTDGSAAYLRSLYVDSPCFSLVINRENLGVGAGRNICWQHSTRDYILTLDDDTYIQATQIRLLIDQLSRYSSVGILSPVMIDLTTGREIRDPHDKNLDMTTFLGGCYAIRRITALQAGFHDPLCDFGGEELDLSIKVRHLGFQVWCSPNITVSHNGFVRSGVEYRVRSERWLQNHTRVLFKYFPFCYALPWSLIMLISHLKSFASASLLHAMPSLIFSYFQGISEGMNAHRPVSQSVIQFYKSRLGIRNRATSVYRRLLSLAK